MVMEDMRRARGRPRQDTAEEQVEAQRHAKKKYSENRIALGTGPFQEWENHRVTCGFGSHVTFVQHLLTLHEGHCPGFIALGQGRSGDQGDGATNDGRHESPLIKSLDLASINHAEIDAEHRHLTSAHVKSTPAAFDAVSESGSDSEQLDSVSGEHTGPETSVNLILVDDVATRWHNLQELAGYQEADLQFLCWLLELAERMLSTRAKKTSRSQQHDKKSKYHSSRGRRSLRLKGNRVWYREREEDEYDEEAAAGAVPSALHSYADDVVVKEEVVGEMVEGDCAEEEEEEEDDEEGFDRETLAEQLVCNLCGYITVDQDDLEHHSSECHSEPEYMHQTTNCESVSGKEPVRPVKRKRGRPPKAAKHDGQSPTSSREPKSKTESKTTRKRGRPPIQKPKVMFICDDCKEQFPHEYSYKMHRHKWHSEEAPIRNYTCETCGKTYGTLPSLAAHQKTHTQARPCCPICNKETANNQNLRKHIEVVHQQIRKHCCEVCGRLFTQAQHLLHHKRTVHLGTHKVHCTWPNCGKVFNKKHNLTIHMRIHLDEKPLRCDYCDFRCRQRNSMTWHMKKHHGVKHDQSSDNPDSAPTGQIATDTLDRIVGETIRPSNSSAPTVRFDPPRLSSPQPRTAMYEPLASAYDYQLPSVSHGPLKTASLPAEAPHAYRSRSTNSGLEEADARPCLYQSMPVFPPQSFSYTKQETCVPYPRSSDDPINSSR